MPPVRPAGAPTPVGRDVPLLDFVRIEPGRYRQGSADAALAAVAEVWEDVTPSRLADEQPVRQVRIARPFEIGRREVSQAEYQRVTGSNPSTRKDAALPVHNLTHGEAEAFCAKLTVETGRRHRLPTEAEWEYACRAGTRTLWSFGDDDFDLDERVWYQFSAETGLTASGRLPANPWGLHDMHGNAAEWCADRYGADAYAGGDAVDPAGPETGAARVVRGGSFADEGWRTRSAARTFLAPDQRRASLGFRVVREIPAAAGR